MREHLKYLCFKTFLIVSWGSIWFLFVFPTKAPNIYNSCTNTTPEVVVHLGIIRFHPLHSPPIVKMCFTPKHNIGLMGPCTSHLVTDPMLRLQQLSSMMFHVWVGATKMGNINFNFNSLSWCG
jgi:hypothetical protein